ncbi:MAG: helicase-related protein [Owenweeksia sp.]|nr:helicase-related protein [Owenweeksia sp.]
MRNRKHCVEVARWLQQNGISADFYHAGLPHADRKVRQENWLKNRKRIMVSTNAFGMGIDKPDVRLILHLDLPDSLEAYFQEAGRAGRDGQRAYSVVIVGPSDMKEMYGRYLSNFPDMEFVKRLYQALTNYLQLAIGSGEGQSFAFDLVEFSRHYNLPIMKAYQTLNILEREGLIALTENFRQPSRVRFTVNRTELYDFQLRNPRLDSSIKTLSRSDGGLDVEYTAINELQMARRLGVTEPVVRKTLLHLKKQGLIDYVERQGDTQITFYQERQVVKYLTISDENLKDRYEDRKKRLKAVEDFVTNTSRCRSIQLLHYFGENTQQECGHCDICRRSKSTGMDADEFETLKKSLVKLLAKEGQLSHQEVVTQTPNREEKIVNLIKWLTEEGSISQKGRLVKVDLEQF